MLDKMLPKIIGTLLRPVVLYSVTSGIAVCVVLIVYISVYVSATTELAVVNEEAALQTQQLRVLEDQARSMPKPIDDETLKKLFVMIPSTDKNVDFLEEVNKYQKKTSIKLKSLDSDGVFENAYESLVTRINQLSDKNFDAAKKQQATEGARAIKQKFVSITVEGTYDNVMKFWRGLVRRFRFVDTASWTMQFDNQGQAFTGEQRTNLEIELRVYSSPDNNDLQKKL
ncbi:MAG: hypothetical protein KGO83_06390 [Paenibacillaceae bacterium]|nr:hypothetical protein [Paenibacillaceae bacterium]